MTFQVFDPSGSLMVDAGMLGFACRKSGTSTTQGGIGNSVASSALVNLAGFTAPIVAIVMSGGYAAALAGKYHTGGTFWHFCTDAPMGTAFSYYIFEQTSTIPSPSGMLQLFNPAGQCTFDSARWPMKGVGMLSSAVSIGSGAPEALTRSGRQLAVCCGQIGGHYAIASAWCQPPGQEATPDVDFCTHVWVTTDGKRYGAKITNGGQTITFEQVSFDDTTGIIGASAAYHAFVPWYVHSQIMAIDVTDIPLNTTFF